MINKAIAALILFACGSFGIERTVTIHGKNAVEQYEIADRGKFGFRVSVKYLKQGRVIGSSKIYIEHPTYQFQVADLNGDGKCEILVGVVKKTRFDSTLKKRLFIYETDEGIIRPLWLGSKVGKDLKNFKVVQKGTDVLVKTVETDGAGRFFVGMYKLGSFGLKWQKYLREGINSDAAIEIFGS